MVRIILTTLLLVASLTTAEPTTQPAPLRIVCFGDSITGDRPRKPYLHQYLKYTDILQTIIQATGRDAVVLNRGWAGDATFAKPGQSMPGALGRLKSDVIDEKPDLAIILIGGNDASAKNVTPETTRDNLRSIARQLSEAKIRTLFVQYHVLPNPENPDKAWKHLVRNNDVIADAAKEFDFPVLPMQPAMDAALQQQPLAELVNTTDGVHLSPGGELVYAKTIYQKLKALGWLEGD